MRKKNKKLIVVLFAVVFLFFLSWQIILATFLNGDYTPAEPEPHPGVEDPYIPDPPPEPPPPPPPNSPDNPFPPPAHTNIGVCVNPPYPDLANPSQPIFSWTTFGNLQRHYWLMVDNNFDFSSPEINTGAVYSVTQIYQTSPGQLAQNQTYWWKVAVRDDHGWTGWTGCTSFFLPNRPPSTTNLSVSQPSCYPWGTSPQPTLRWTFSDPDHNDYQTAYQVQIDNNSDFSSPEVDSGKVSSGANSYTVPAGKLNYSTLYYWRVMVWDKYNVNSDWANSSFTTSPFCNDSPSAINLKVSQPDYCRSGPAAIFSWTFTDPDFGDYQTAYRVQVDNNSNFSSPEDDSGKVISSSNSYATPLGKLSYNTTYYWRLMVWDRADASSAWIPGPSFTTPKHGYPSIDFSWLPEKPTVDEIVQFTDKSVVFGGATKVSWSWTFQDAIPSSSNQQNPSVKFISTGPKIVTLKVTDSNGFACTGQKTVGARLPLPDWREIPPILWLKNFLASLGEIFSNTNTHFTSFKK